MATRCEISAQGGSSYQLERDCIVLSDQLKTLVAHDQLLAKAVWQNFRDGQLEFTFGTDNVRVIGHGDMFGVTLNGKKFWSVSCGGMAKLTPGSSVELGIGYVTFEIKAAYAN